MNMTRTIRGTIYQLTIHIQDDGISMEDAILRLILNQTTFRREPPAPATALEKAIV